MKIAKRIFIIISALLAIVIAVLISIQAYYIAIMLFLGILLVGHREIWSLLTRRKMPPIDERVRENISKSVRNGFVFIIVSLALLTLPFATFVAERIHVGDILSVVFISGSLAYALSYFFYDRIAPRLTEGGWGMLKVFLVVAGIGFVVGVLSIFLHNFISHFMDLEEPVFFTIAVFIAPLAVIVGLLGSAVIAVRALLSKSA